MSSTGSPGTIRSMTKIITLTRTSVGTNRKQTPEYVLLHGAEKVQAAARQYTAGGWMIGIAYLLQKAAG